MKTSASIEINRPIADVYAYVSDVRHMDRWVAGVGDVRLVSGEPGAVGSRYESDYTYGGRTHEMTYEVTATSPPNRLAMRGEGPFPFEGELTLVAMASGTRVTNTLDAESDGRFTSAMFAVFGPILRRMMARQLHKELETLKRALESGSGGVEATA